MRLKLGLLVVLIFCGLLLTHYFVGLHRATEAELAKRWFARGNQAMQAGNAGLAADDFRTALSYDRDNRQYRLRLSEALLAANHLNEARAYLTSLWEQGPADGEVNLELARLYAKRNLASEAVRYYRNAINGAWNQAALDQRVAARFELVDYLMQLRDQQQAAAELMALQADEPRGIADQLQLGDLLRKVNEPVHARDVYKRLLESEPGNAAALLGLGEALLDMGDYRQAGGALASAVEHDPSSPEARRQLALAREVLRVAPSLRDLSLAERTRRVASAFSAAFERLTSCSAQQGFDLSRQSPVASSAPPKKETPPMAVGNVIPVAPIPPSPAPDNLQLLYTSGLQKQTSATESALRKNPDALEPVMQYVFDVERATATLCPNMSETDRALLTLAQHQGESLR